MTEIYLIRHAQAEGNTYRMMQGHWDGKLTPTGHLQVEALAERFRDISVDALYSSDLIRTVETAGAITKYHDLPIRTDPALREINMGPWELQFYGNLQHYQPEAARFFWNDPEKWYIEGAETYADVTARAVPALRRIAEANDGKTVAVVSHGVACRCILAALTHRPLVGENALPIFGNTAVSRLLYSGGEFTVDYFGDCSHTAHIPLPKWENVPYLWDAPFDSEKDGEFYKACYADAWTCAHGDLTGFSPLPYLQSAVKHSLDGPGSVLCLYEGENRVGVIDMDPHRGESLGCGWISLLYVREEYRHRSVGVQALARALAYFSARGRRAIRLNVAESNADAVRFYTRWGFRQISYENAPAGRLLLMERPLETT